LPPARVAATSAAPLCDVIGDIATRRRPSARRRVGCATARPRRLAGATSTTSLRLAARRGGATPAPRQLRHRTSSHAPPRWRRENYVIARRRHNFYSHYTPFQSARQPSEITNSPSHIF